MLTVGMPVLVGRAEEQRIGVVVGAAQVGGEVFYQVSLEDAIQKGVLECEVTPAAPDTVRAVLGWLARDPELQALQPNDVSAAKKLYLRSAYMEELREAADFAERADKASAAAMPFEPGAQVALQEEGLWSLGIAMGARSVAGKVMCVIDVLGDVRQVPLDEVLLPQDAPISPEGLYLGARVRFVVAGHEADDDYLATICTMTQDADPIFSIAFDDEDVLEDLGPQDLVLA